MTKVLNITLAGVGGQGTLLAGEILCNVALLSGRDVKKSEVHGMAQRGGSVSTQIRYGSKVYSPIIGRGEADVLVAFEKMEAVRYAEFLKPSGMAVINDAEIIPLPVASGDKISRRRGGSHAKSVFGPYRTRVQARGETRQRAMHEHRPARCACQRTRTR